MKIKTKGAKIKTFPVIFKRSAFIGQKKKDFFFLFKNGIYSRGGATWTSRFEVIVQLIFLVESLAASGVGAGVAAQALMNATNMTV